MKKALIICCVCLLAQPPSIAQVHPLTVGDSLPHLLLHNILNFHSASASTASARGKLLLLDFGATTCLPCIKAIPLLDSMQRLFPGDLQVFMVTREKKQKVSQFLSKNKFAKNSRLPVITEDTLLAAFFPHTALPHEVWINADGIITAITGHEYINAANIKKIIDKQPVNWPLKSDAQPGPMAENSNGYITLLKDPLYFSSFSRYTPGYKKGFSTVIDTAKNTVTITCINLTVPEIYKSILGLKPGSFYPKQLIVDTSILPRCFYDSSIGYRAAWEQQNTYCYRQSFPRQASLQQLRQKMMLELDICIGITAQFEKQQQDCWVLRLGDSLLATGSKSKKKQGQLSVRAVLNFYNMENHRPLAMNETGWSGNQLNRIFINITAGQLHNEELVAKAFKNAGLDWRKEKRWVNILQFSPP